MAARFVDPAAQPQTAQVEVPEGLQQVSVLLEAQRVVGGNLSAGDTVGVLLSVDKKTHLTLQKVLVTRVQGAAAPVQDEAEDGAAADALPESSLMVTLALEAGQAEQVVFTAEHGTIWLSLQDEATDESGTDVVTAESVHR
nr:RcpC/CpaB family pilus assembly protein [Auraticoccus cholistanensis]